MQPLARIHAVERLVEQQDRAARGRARRRSSPAAACPSSTSPTGRSAAAARSTVSIARAVAAAGSGRPWRRAASVDELATGEERVDGLALRDEPDPAVDRRVVPGRPAVDEDATRRRPQQPRQQVQERRLAGAVRAEQARDARADRERDVVDRDDVAEPARDAVEDDRLAAGCRARIACGAAGSGGGSVGAASVSRDPAKRRATIATATRLIRIALARNVQRGRLKKNRSSGRSLPKKRLLVPSRIVPGLRSTRPIPIDPDPGR